MLGGKENRRQHGGKVEIYMRTGAPCFRGTRRFCRGDEKRGIEWSLGERITIFYVIFNKEVLLRLGHNSYFFVLCKRVWVVCSDIINILWTLGLHRDIVFPKSCCMQFTNETEARPLNPQCHLCKAIVCFWESAACLCESFSIWKSPLMEFIQALSQL